MSSTPLPTTPLEWAAVNLQPRSGTGSLRRLPTLSRALLVNQNKSQSGVLTRTLLVGSSCGVQEVPNKFTPSLFRANLVTSQRWKLLRSFSMDRYLILRKKPLTNLETATFFKPKRGKIKHVKRNKPASATRSAHTPSI